MCKCSITSKPLPSNTPRNDFTVEVAVRSESPATASEGSDDISILNLRHDMVGEEGSNGDQDSDNASSHTSDAPLLGMEGEPTVQVVPYSPQVELNLPLPSNGCQTDEMNEA